MEKGEKIMRTHMRARSEGAARGRLASEEWGRIDPMVYLTEARRRQARAVAEVLGAAWRGLRGWFARRSERRRAIAQLTALDDRLLADIGLRRSDIELAVDGLLADPRVTPRTAARAMVASDYPLERQPRPMAAATANAHRPAVPAQPNRVADLAA
jgi:uncharacterized protein YjiS (DUF1127 family)